MSDIKSGFGAGRRREGAMLGLAGLLLIGCLGACGTLMTGSAPSDDREAPGIDRSEDEGADVGLYRGIPTQVVVISVEGLSREMYALPNGDGILEAADSAAPYLVERARRGAYADRVETEVPGLFYPAHASLLTGRRADRHGIFGDLPMGDQGLSRMPYWNYSNLVGDSLLIAAHDHKVPSAVLNWPTTIAAPADHLLPDVEPRPQSVLWIEALEGRATPGLIRTIRELSSLVQLPTWPSASQRDSLVTGLACSLAASETPPRLWLLRYSQMSGAIAASGQHSDATAQALAAIDAELERLAACFGESELLRDTTFVVTGDRGFAPVHTRVRPNRVLAQAGLLTPRPYGAKYLVESWAAFVRAYGGSAFVYARDQESAVLARAALKLASEETGAFEIVPATELRDLHGDPEAWFALRPAPGFYLDNMAEDPVLYPAEIRAADGLFPDAPAGGVGFVAWGAGIRSGVQVPLMRQIDVAPTVAALLHLALPDTDGRVLIGTLDPAVLIPRR